jgi:hypothetical protein
MGLTEGEMLNCVASTTTNSRHFNFFVSDDVIAAVEEYLCFCAAGRIISTFSAVQEVRDKVPDCVLSDDQIERFAGLSAADQGMAVHFDRRGRKPDPYSSLSRSHWHLVPIWKTELRPRLGQVSIRRPNVVGLDGRALCVEHRLGLFPVGSSG